VSSQIQKIGFWSVFALVTGSQIGSGVFMLPANLAPYGFYSLLGWLISGIGAIALALVFGRLCAWFPKTGGPHVYVHEAFGWSSAFFTGWTYWIVSWVSTTVVVIACIGYLSPVIGVHGAMANLALELVLLLAITALNLQGVSAAGRTEFVLTALKVVPLFIVPVLALCCFKSSNFALDQSVANLSTLQLLSRVTLLTLWGFIGLEAATAPAGSVENPSQTIPRAIAAGTACVALLYIINSMGIMGIIPGSELMNSNAPYADATKAIFGGNWHLIISLIAAVICIGTLNAWILTSGQIALGLAQDGLIPSIFKERNQHGAPAWSLLISSACIVPFLIMTASESLAAQLLMIIDFSVTAFLFVYLIACLAFFKILFSPVGRTINRFFGCMYGLIALLFCSWVIYETALSTILIAGLFTLSGLPIYAYYLSKKLCSR
jgi:APA family basic amino acid/polyamine antiporter